MECNSSLPDKKVCKEFSQQEAIEYMSKVIQLLECSKNSFQNNADFIYDLILRLSTSYFDYYHKFIDKICFEFIEKDVVKIIHHYLTELSKALDLKNRTVILMLTWLANFSDHSEIFSQQIIKSKSSDVIIDLILKVNLFNLSDSETNQFIYICVVIISNCARHPANSVLYKVEDFKQRLLKFIEINNNDKLGIVSMLTLSYMVEEDDVYLLNDCSSTVGHLIKLIQSTMELDKRSDGFTLYEMIYGLLCISANDNMKQCIFEEGGIPILLKILQRDNGKQIEAALGTIEQLCFKENIKLKLRNDYQLEDVVKRFENNDNEKIRSHLEGISWNMKNKWESRHQESNDETEPIYDVFISYSWTNKGEISAILSHFKKSNICFWIDEEQMKGSCFEAMAKGIENSSFIVIALSRSYYKSANCRREAEYAARLNKPIIPLRMEVKYKPGSWLGFITGSELYYEFSGYRNKEIEILRLLKFIQANLGANSTKTNKKSNPHESELDCHTRHRHHVRDRSKLTDDDDVLAWKYDDVLQWLRAYNLGHLRDAFARIDGSLIFVMLDIRSRSADYFNNCLKNEFGMNFVDVLVFHKALNELQFAA